MPSKCQIAAIALAATAAFTPIAAQAITIGYYDSSRELYGLDGGYLAGARQWLTDNGHTLISTNNVDAAFLGGVDAFYTGLIGSISNPEITAMQNFVDVSGGFLFIQQDHDSGPWHAPSSSILSNWGITNSPGTFDNDSGHYTVAGSEWVTDPNVVTGIAGSVHSVVGTVPTGFEVIARDDLDRIIMGVFDAGAGRSSDILVATDIDFWSDGYGWNDSRNRALWENIWAAVERQVDPDPDPQDVPAPAAIGLFGLAALALGALRRKTR